MMKGHLVLYGTRNPNEPFVCSHAQAEDRVWPTRCVEASERTHINVADPDRG